MSSTESHRQFLHLQKLVYLRESRTFCRWVDFLRLGYRQRFGHLGERLKTLRAWRYDARLRKELKRVAQAFRQEGLPLVLGGGFALDYHRGYAPKPHGDLDIVVWEDWLERSVELLRAIGYKGFAEDYGARKGLYKGLNLDIFVIRRHSPGFWLTEARIEVKFPDIPATEPVDGELFGESLKIMSAPCLWACYQMKGLRAIPKFEGIEVMPHQQEQQAAKPGIVVIGDEPLSVPPPRKPVTPINFLLRLSRLVHAERIHQILDHHSIDHAFFGDFMSSELGWGGLNEFWSIPVLVNQEDWDRTVRLLTDRGGVVDEWGVWLWGSRVNLTPLQPEGEFVWRNYKFPLKPEVLKSPPMYQIGFLRVPSLPEQVLKACNLVKRGVRCPSLVVQKCHNPRITVSFASQISESD